MSTFVNSQAALPVAATVEDRARRIRKMIIRSIVTLALLGLLFWQVPFRDVWAAIQGMDKALLGLVLLLSIPTIWLQYVRWATLAKDAGPNVSKADIHRGFWVGFTLGLITPGRVGQYGPALALHNCSLSRAAGLTFLERMYSALVINGVGLIALVTLPFLGWLPPFPTVNTIVGLGCVLVGVVFLALGIFPGVISGPLLWLTKKLPFREKLARAIDVLQLVSPARGAWLLLLAILSVSSSLLQFVVLLYALGSPVPVFAGMMAALLTFFLKGNIPLGVGNLGVGEWTAVICLSGFGVGAPTAVAASLMLFVINVFLPGLVGIPFISSLRMPNWAEPAREAA